MASPDRVSFLGQAATGANFIPLWRRWPADLDTPLSTWLKVGHGRPYGLLLESVEGGDQLGHDIADHQRGDDERHTERERQGRQAACQEPLPDGAPGDAEE